MLYKLLAVLALATYAMAASCKLKKLNYPFQYTLGTSTARDMTVCWLRDVFWQTNACLVDEGSDVLEPGMVDPSGPVSSNRVAMHLSPADYDS